MLQTIRTIFLLVIGVPVLGLIAWFGIKQYWSGDGEIVLVAPDGSPMQYSIDGQAEQSIVAGSHLALHVHQGPHEVELTTRAGAVTRKVKVTSGFQRMLTPSLGQCFVLLDVSKSHYGTADGEPEIKERVAATGQLDLPSELYYDESALPHSIKEGHSCKLLLEVECDALDGDDHRVLAALGYQGK
jgi:hypothetical protein